MLSASRALRSSPAARCWSWPRTRWLALPTFVRVLVGGVACYGLLAPPLALVHELIVLAVAHLMGDLAWYAATSGLLRALPLDPIYTSAALLTLGGIEPRGLALAAPLGPAIHERWPAVFQPPALLAAGAWASAVVAPGSTVVSRWLCSALADAALIGLGVLAIRTARPGRRWLLVAGVIVHAHVVVNNLVDAPPDLAEVEAAGVPFAIAMLLSGDVQAGPRLAETLEGLSDPVRDVVLGLGITAIACLPVLAALLATALLRRLGRPAARPAMLPRNGRLRSGWQRERRRTMPGRLADLHPVRVGKVLVLAALALAIAVSPLGDLADARTHFLAAAAVDELSPNALTPEPASTGSGASAEPAVLAPNGGPAPPAGPSLGVPAQPAGEQSSPSVVAVSGSGYRYQYTVNGIPQVIRGIGYNVQYRRLAPEERTRRLDRDFAELRKAGVNTVFGWEQDEFDVALLDAAQRHGLGVAPPFELDPEAAYGDPAVRERITREVVAWVQQQRHHPAVRMWAIGNEVLHKLVYPSWMPMRSNPAWEQRAREFARFYVELIDAVHAVDPDHPVVHRDAEDAYLTWLRDALQSSQPRPDTLPGDAPPSASGHTTGRRPWLIYGINAYTPRLAEILTSWPHQGWDTPLLVSEFAPGGMSPADRPQGLREMWKMVRGANGWVLGGSVYAWTTDGPEEVDRVFGLVDGAGKPVDGAFAAISAVYRGAARQAQPARITPAQVGDARVWHFARYAIGAIQEGRGTDLLPATADTSIMGDVGNVARTAPQDAELTVQRVRDQRRVAWAEENGVRGEWWVTWQPRATPSRQLTFAVQEYSDGTLGVQYIYHGPR
ncbi:MAG: hypothetical protein IT306_19695 [Chloroflexi bacterium]|nr:hypothetical protein [Chloroflexota bacterium]